MKSILGLVGAIGLSVAAMQSAAGQVRPIGTAPPTMPTLSQYVDKRPAGPPPTAVRATAISPTTVRITWQAVLGASGYAVVRTTPGSSSTMPVTLAGEPVGGPGSTGITRLLDYVDSGRRPGAQYTYAVLALQPATSKYSAGRSGAVPVTMPQGVPATGLTATRAGVGAVSLVWQAAPDASGYLVIRDNAQLTTQPVRGTSYTDTGVLAGIHTYRVVPYYRVEGLGEIEGDIINSPVVRIVVTRCGT